MSQILEKIRSRGWWTVRIRPLNYQNDTPAALADLEEAVRTSAVELRGWPFPHYDCGPRSIRTRTADYIGQELDWKHYVEMWRAYKSGQFISLSALWEDWRDKSTLWPAPPGWAPGITLSVENAVHRLAEIFEFAARWARAIPVGDKMVVECAIHGLQSRALQLAPTGPGFFCERRCSVPKWKWAPEYPTAEVFSSPREHAISPAVNLFELFGWDGCEDKVREIQGTLRT
ncbi:MAG: hypothetical protein COZ06_24395 [Armatimonadetes bacterium CG_4_10_14_3_um_filter_66_18]|nr:hypothetical protein [Armatimonadota bacterium]OIO96756.1 MAG: hypothetical protein AUJ96_24295 [Armatimonadetes bacterium CG2_30_66_41]PIX38042.1 MAG: hypothetical protein COZ57_31555 [Armatimonadetes bacterium CG_4_8_14_3_um_filter_66_20]PIY42800.1 MAG: hypothetical protein COZ06_24395 [Armatimonadetes bacterium CG_4_10_14_3_um_filter_66_18]PIZ34664.1 MAG: hypothetical protein COY42_28190 [Armatimonadetes bacterium CG_4_10_14_0_8_um_filter_66_14]